MGILLVTISQMESRIYAENTFGMQGLLQWYRKHCGMACGPVYHLDL